MDQTIVIRDGRYILKQSGVVAEGDIRELADSFTPRAAQPQTQFLPHEDRTCAMIASTPAVTFYAMYLAPKERHIKIHNARREGYTLTWPHTYLFLYCQPGVAVPSYYFAKCASKKITSESDIIGTLPMPNVSTGGKVCNGTIPIPQFVRDKAHSVVDIVEQYPQIFTAEPFNMDRAYQFAQGIPGEFIQPGAERPQDEDVPRVMAFANDCLDNWEKYSKEHTPEEVCRLSWDWDASSVGTLIKQYVR